jgi:hypothetical protein
MTFFSTADYRELVWIHPRLFVEDVFGGGGGGDECLDIGCPLLNVAGLPTEDNLPHR